MIRAGVLQYAPAFGEVRRNLETVAHWVERAGKLDLLVLPELFSTGYRFVSREEAAALAEPFPDGPACKAMARWAAALGGVVVGGFAERDGDRLCNSAAVFGPSGPIGLYRKVHLFAEETEIFAPGDRGFPVWGLPWGRLGVMVCYDWRFPEAARTLALAGADVIAHPSNLVHRQCPRVMPARAIENRVFTLTADRTGEDARPGKPALRFAGQSLGVAPSGEVLFLIPPGEEKLVALEIDPAAARDKSLNPQNDILQDRRPEQYRL